MVRRLALLTLIALLGLPAAAQLAAEGSRYLQDGASGPVKWQAWGEAAFARARREKKPVFVSVGYAASYETFLMRQGAFAGAENVKALNDWYVPVLLDRIEMPEVARAYERVAASLASVSGWPVNLVLTPELEPFAAAGSLDAAALQLFLVTAANRWDGQREKTIAEARAAIEAARPKAEGSVPMDRAAVEAVVDAIAATYDAKHGGFGTAPKYPRPMTISFLFRYAQLAKHDGIRGVGIDTIRKMANSAIHDQLGSGFHRATLDAEWKQPRFEKLLEDQALMAMASLEAWQLTKDPALAGLTRATLDFALRDMHAPSGGFDASMDAYSLVPNKGPEEFNGAFYYWGRPELQHIFRDKAPRLFALYGIADEGKSIPVLALPAVLKEPDVPALVQKMYEIRQTRPAPARDFDEIASLQGLMISALSRAGVALDEKRYLSAALETARVVTTKLWDEKKKKLYRNDAATKPRHEALAQDYALVVQGLLDLFEATYDVKWLELAMTLQQRQDELFWESAAGRYATGTTVPAPLRALVAEQDDGTPSANAAAATNLLRFGAITGNAAYTERASMIFAAHAGALRARGGELPQLANAYVLSLQPAKQIVLVADPRKTQTYDLLRTFHQQYSDLRGIVLVPPKGAARERIERLIPAVKAMKNDTDKPIAWLCIKATCQTKSDF